MNKIVTIILSLIALACAVYVAYYLLLLNNVDEPEEKTKEKFAYKSEPMNTSTCKYNCLQNDNRPEVLTTYGTYATQECQSLCKD
jgi:hypothetical protein